MTKRYKSHRRLLTDAFCASTGPGVYTDTGCPGLRLNVSGLDRRTFQHQYQITGEGKMSDAGTGNRLRGKIKKLLVGHFPATSLASARALVVTQRKLAQDGINPRDPSPTAATHIEGVDVVTPAFKNPSAASAGVNGIPHPCDYDYEFRCIQCFFCNSLLVFGRFYFFTSTVGIYREETIGKKT